MTVEFYRQIFGKSSNIKFHENPSNGGRVVPCGLTDGQTETQRDRQTDAHDEGNSRFFCSIVKGPTDSLGVKCAATGH